MTATAVREKPILFSGEMVRAILAGKKTQTRRVVKPQPPDGYETDSNCPGYGTNPWLFVHSVEGAGMDGLVWNCPYGAPGQRLWVRETWGTVPLRRTGDPAQRTDEIVYAATEAMVDDELRYIGKYRPSIHMPRWASRLTLEITDVRVQRLQEISAKDILAEGAVARAHDDEFGHNPVSAFDGICYLDLRSLWAAGWSTIHKLDGPNGWRANPWVWAITFKRLP